MPSNRNPLTTATPGAGKLHADIATASAQLFASGGGSATLLAFLNLVAQRDLAIVKKTAPVAAAGQVNFDLRAVETDPIWVSNNPATIPDDLFIIVEVGTDGASFKAAAGSIIRISSITGPTIGDGFITGPITINFSSALPTGPTFEIWYAVQRQVATITVDSFSFPNIRQARGISRVVQELLEDLHAATGQTWDDSWDSTIEALAASGLNGRYRRQTTVPGSFTYDTPGDGAVIIRDGVSPQSLATEAFSDYPNTPIVDPFWAQWRTGISGVDQGSIPVPNVRDGGMGFVSIGSRRNTSDANELTRIALSAGSHLTAHPRNITASTLNAAAVRTRIDATVPCTLNPDSGGTPTDKATLAVTGTNFFVNGSGNTEVVVGYDLLRIEYTGGLSSRQDEVYIIESILSATRVLLRMLSGGQPSFPGAATTDCRCQLIKTVAHMGGGAAPWLASDAQLDAALYHAVIPAVTDDPATATEVTPNPARFLAAARTATEYSHTGSPVPNALVWGGFDPTLSAPQSFPGKLRGDGGVDATIVKNTTRAISISASGTTTWHPGLEGSILHVDFTHAAGTITWTLAMHADYDPVDGERLEVILRPAPNAPPTGTAEVTIVWPVASPNTFFGWGTAGIIINEISRIKLTHFSGVGFSGWLLSQTNLQNISYIQKVPFIQPRNVSVPAGGGAITWRPMSEGGYLTLSFSDGLAYSLVVTGEAGTVVFPDGGFKIDIEVEQGPGGATMTWPVDFLFSGADAILPPNAGDRVLYRGIYSNLASKWLMTRTDY